MSEEIFRPISTGVMISVTAPADFGPAPVLQWIAIADLVVDTRYQRPLNRGGTSNVRAIAANFRWSKFAPIVASPVGGGKFAIIDGQHRATAAMLIGIDSVPVNLIIADRAEQAAAFKSINGDVTRVHALHNFAAACEAGEADYVGAREAARCAGVEILRYPTSSEQVKAGQTLACQTVLKCYCRYGRDVLVTALQCITETSNNVPGALGASLIQALCVTLMRKAVWLEAGERLLAAMDEIDLPDLLDRSLDRRERRGRTKAEFIESEIEVHLGAALGAATKAA